MEQVTTTDPLDWVLGKIGAAKKAPVVVKSVQKKPPEKKDFSQQRVKEVQLWQDWKSSGFHPKKMEPLYKSMENLVHNAAKNYKGRVEIPNAAIDWEFKKIFAESARRWDHSKGAQLHSWVTDQMNKRIQRFIKTNQNFARIPEYRLAKVNKFKAVKAELTEKLGFEPDTQTLAEETGFHPKEIKRLTKELRKGLIASGEADDIPQLLETEDARLEEVKHLIVPQLTPQERIVHEYTFGMFGKPRLKTSQLAKKMGWDDSKVSKLKKAIATKMNPYLGDL
jgi:DNA-directed RNA polymerase specialized sigma subunit